MDKGLEKCMYVHEEYFKEWRIIKVKQKKWKQRTHKIT